MFVYTSAKKEYAEKILDILDPKRMLFRHRLYQQNCTCVLGHYVKDLGVLERDLAKTVVLDNAPHTYPYHLMNVLPIKSWSGNDEDKELQKLIPCLERLSGADDFREVLKRRTDHFHRLLSEDWEKASDHPYPGMCLIVNMNWIFVYYPCPSVWSLLISNMYSWDRFPHYHSAEQNIPNS